MLSTSGRSWVVTILISLRSWSPKWYNLLMTCWVMIYQISWRILEIPTIREDGSLAEYEHLNFQPQVNYRVLQSQTPPLIQKILSAFHAVIYLINCCLSITNFFKISISFIHYYVYILGVSDKRVFYLHFYLGFFSFCGTKTNMRFRK